MNIHNSKVIQGWNNVKCLCADCLIKEQYRYPKSLFTYQDLIDKDDKLQEARAKSFRKWNERTRYRDKWPVGV